VAKVVGGVAKPAFARDDKREGRHNADRMRHRNGSVAPMFLIRIFLNGLIMAAEIAAVVAVAAFGYLHPFLFAATTAALAFAAGLLLEYQRITFELPFYFERGRTPRLWFAAIVGFGEAFIKALLAGVAAVFTFAGTESDRLFWVAVAFGVSVYLGAGLLRWLSLSLDARPARWGYFRLAGPLGVLFSAGLTLLALVGTIPLPSISDIGLKVLWQLPPVPSVEQVSELVFQLKQAFDDFVVKAIAVFVPLDVARVIGIFLSVNMLTGFVSALYASLIASAVRRAEDTLL
jgi:hypothetical protein